MADLSNVEVTLFDSEVKMAYAASGGALTGAVRNRDNVVGGIVKFPKSGTIQAIETGFRSNIPTQNLSFDEVSIALKKYTAAVYSDDVERHIVNFDERMIIVEETVAAIRRRQDQQIIDAWGAAALPSDNQIGVSYGTGTDTNLTWDKMRRISGLFSKNNVPKIGRHLAIASAQDEYLLDILQLTNNQYSNVARNAIDNGTLDGSSVLGMNIHVIGTMDEGGLPLNTGTNVRTCYAWHDKSTGMATGIKFKSHINYVAEKDSDLILTKFYGNSVVIDPTGVISIACDEDDTSV